MLRTYRLFLEDMHTSVKRILEQAGNVPLERLQSDQALQETVLWNLHVLGEAVKHVPKEFLSAHPEVNWRKVAAMRNKVIHAYFGIDWGIVQHTIQNQLPQLEVDLHHLLDNDKDGNPPLM